ncbi:MAG: hypothetical protein SVK54_04975 [candidate division WOR-3 bacterium]|nr:hypothetical protein [candidate division WOR-3 bacterium]
MACLGIHVVQIPKHRALSLMGDKVEVRWNQKYDLFILYKNRVVYSGKLPDEYIKAKKRKKELFSRRTLYIT